MPELKYTHASVVASNVRTVWLLAGRYETGTKESDMCARLWLNYLEDYGMQAELLSEDGDWKITYIATGNLVTYVWE